MRYFELSANIRYVPKANGYAVYVKAWDNAYWAYSHWANVIPANRCGHWVS